MESFVSILLLIFLIYVPLTLHKINKRLKKLSEKVEREVLIYASHSDRKDI